MNLAEVVNFNSPIVKNTVLGNLAKVLKKLNKRKVSFQYETQSNKHQNYDNDIIVLSDTVEGTIHPECIEKCNNGEYILRLKNVNKRKATHLGEGKNPNQKLNSPLWRSYRLEGIDLASFKVKRDNVWKNIFTN